MGLRAQHVEQARRNRAIAEHLVRALPDDPAARQWIVIAAFYCAVHCVEAHLADHGFHARSHEDRGHLMLQPFVVIPGDVRRAYRRLKDQSNQARYPALVAEP